MNVRLFFDLIRVVTQVETNRTAMPLMCALLIYATAVADRPRVMFDYVLEHGAGQTMGARVPNRSLGEDDVERWAKILNASESQLQFMMLMYERFVADHNQYLDREAPRYLPLGVEMVKVRRTAGADSPEFLSHLKRINRANARVRRQLTAIEQSFITSFESMLTDEQRALVGIMRDEAARGNCRTFWSSGVRGLHIELREIWEFAAASDASPAERERVQLILTEYERRLTPLVCRRADIDFTTGEDLAANRIALDQGRVTAQEQLAQYRQIMDRRLEASLRIRSLNEQYAQRIAEALSPELASAFTAAVKQNVFPELYPDEAALQDYLEALANDEEIGADERRIAAIVLDDYAAEYQSACRDLEAMCVKWGDMREAGISGFQSQFLAGALEPLLQARQELSHESLMKLTEHLELDVLKRHAKLIPQPFRSMVDAEAENAPALEEP